MAEGLPIGAWHTRIGCQRIYNLCNDGVLETAKHGLIWCATIQEAWSKFRELRVRYALLVGHSSWEDILLGELQPPRNEVTIKKEIEWDIGKSCISTLTTPWDVFRSSLLIHLVSKMWARLERWTFSLRYHYFWAWQTTIQMGMATCRELHRFKRSINKHTNL